MLDLVVVDGQARGIVTRNLVTGKIEAHMRPTRSCWPPAATATSSIFRPTPRARNATAIWRAYKRGALFANPCFTQIHPTCIPGHRRVSVQAHADVRIAAQRRPHLGAARARRQAPARTRFPRPSAIIILERRYPSFGNLVPRDVASRNAKAVCDEGRGVGESGLGVYLDFADAIKRLGEHTYRGALRQSVRNVRAHHRRKSLRSPDAHLSRHPLHHGRPVGGLQLDEHHPRPVRARRSELLRPWRQPPGRQRPDAGSGRRLLHPSLHHRQLPGQHQAGQGGRRRTPQFRKPMQQRRRP